MDKEGRPSVGKDESLEPHLQFLLGRFTLLIRRLQTAEQRASSSEEEGRALAQKLAAAERRGGRALDESSSTKRARALAHQLKEKDAQLAEARYGGAPLGSTPGAKRGWVELRPGTAVWVARDSFIALYAGEGAQVSVLLCTVTYYANRAHNLTRSP